MGGAPSAAESFRAFRERLWRLLPFGWRRWIAPSVIGFALINSFTFSVDLLLLWFGYAVVGLAYPVATSLAYATALALAFFLNRSLNFASHAAVGWQAVRYVCTVAVNYLAFILAFNSLLHELGVPFVWARLAAGLCEAVFMYCSMRWFVFATLAPRRRQTWT